MFPALETFCREKKYVCVHADDTCPSKFIFGKIIGVDPNYFAISMVSPDGEYDGLLIKQIDDIVRIEQSESYERKMEKLMHVNGYKEEDVHVSSDNVLAWGLLYAKEKQLVVSAELDHSGIDDVVGFVNEISGTTCKMIQYSEDGEKDGVSFLALGDISQICMDSSDEKRVQALISC